MDGWPEASGPSALPPSRKLIGSLLAGRRMLVYTQGERGCLTSQHPPLRLRATRPKKTSSSEGLFVQSQHTSISLGKRGRTIDLKALYVFAWPKGSIHPDLVPGESVYGLGDRVPLPLILGMNARGGRGSNSRPPKSKRPPSILPPPSVARSSATPRCHHKPGLGAGFPTLRSGGRKISL